MKEGESHVVYEGLVAGVEACGVLVAFSSTVDSSVVVTEAASASASAALAAAAAAAAGAGVGAGAGAGEETGADTEAAK